MLGLGGVLEALPALQLPAALSFPALPQLSLMLLQPLSPMLQPLPPPAAPLLLCLELPGGGLGSSSGGGSGGGARLAAVAAALACVALASSALLSSELVVVSFLLGRTHGEPGGAERGRARGRRASAQVPRASVVARAEAPDRRAAPPVPLAATAGGLGTLLRRSKFRLIASESRNLAHQGGDYLNLLRPRAFQALLVELVGAEGSYMLVLNAHTNLGGDASRHLQIDEIVDASSPAALAAMLERAGLRGVRPDDVPVLLLGDLNAPAEAASVRDVVTKAGFLDAFEERREPAADACSWDARNPLTNGYIKEPDARIDHVLYRPSRRADAGAGAGIAANAEAAAAFDIRAASSGICISRPPYTSDHFGVRADFVAAGVGASARAGAAGVGAAAEAEELAASVGRLHRSVLATAKKSPPSPPSPQSALDVSAAALELSLPEGAAVSSPITPRATPRSSSATSLADPEESEGEQEEEEEGEGEEGQGEFIAAA